MRALPAGNLRAMSWATFANTVGWGMWGAVEALFLTRIVGLTPLQVGTGMTIAGLIGLSASIPLGRLADRRDPRGIRSAIQLGQGVVSLGYLFLQPNLWQFLGLVTLESLLMTSNNTVRAALVSAVGGPTGRVHAFAVLRVVARVGHSVGAGLAAFALAADSRLGYQLLIVGNALTYLVSAGLLLRLPAFTPVAAVAPRGWRALKDVQFLSVTSNSAVMSVHRTVIGLLVPLWIAAHTKAPITVVSLILVVNMVIGMVATVPASRGLTSAAAAALALRRAGIALSVAMVLYAAAALGPRPYAVTLLLLATVAYSIGDLLHATADTSLAYELAEPTSIGEYQGASQLLSGAALALGPIIVGGLVLDRGEFGWLGLAVVFTVTGVAAPALVRWATARRRPTAPLAAPIA